MSMYYILWSLSLLLFANNQGKCSLSISRYYPQVRFFPDSAGGLVHAVINTNVEVNRFFFNNPTDREKDVHFFLYTRFNPDFSEELIIGEEKVLKFSYFNKTSPTKFLIHGFTNSDTFGSIFGAAATWKGFLLSKKRATQHINLIVVEWGRLAQAPWYNDAAKNTRLVGEKVARFIEFLVEQGTILDQIHVIGHSLGAHVAGFAGSSLKNITLPRITALDPALPLFGDVDDENRIDPSDALFVDVLHTAGGSNSERTALAFIEPRGHADFYVNGGRKQPGCGIDLFGTCSHVRAYEYYFESVARPKGFRSCSCNSWDEFKDSICRCSQMAYLGEGCSSSSRGLFYLQTLSTKPYGLN